MKILYFAPVYFSDMKQRPQQIAECLSEAHEVIYVEPTISAMRHLIKGGQSSRGIRFKAKKNLAVLRLNGCLTIHKSLEILDFLGINNIWELFQLRRLIKSCDLVWVGYSGWYTLVRHIRNKPIIFDKMDEEDELVSPKIWKMTLKRNKKKMVELAQVLIVTCHKFYDELKPAGKPVYLVPNAVPGFFLEGSPPPEGNGGRKKAKTFGYIGTIAEWFDMEVVDEILGLDEGYEVVLVGKNCLAENPSPRVTYLGVKDNKELPRIMQAFDVCLYNFKQSPLLDTINPVKIYEYLAANKPVLAVRSMETLKLGERLMLYGDKREIKGILHRGVKRPFANEAEREEFVKENSWRSRTLAINRILDTVGMND